MAAQRWVEGDRTGRPLRVVHRDRWNLWQHDYVSPCHVCDKAGWTVERRELSAAEYDRSLSLLEA